MFHSTVSRHRGITICISIHLALFHLYLFVWNFVDQKRYIRIGAGRPSLFLSVFQVSVGQLRSLIGKWWNNWSQLSVAPYTLYRSTKLCVENYRITRSLEPLLLRFVLRSILLKHIWTNYMSGCLSISGSDSETFWGSLAQTLYRPANHIYPGWSFCNAWQNQTQLWMIHIKCIVSAGQSSKHEQYQQYQQYQVYTTQHRHHTNLTDWQQTQAALIFNTVQSAS